MKKFNLIFALILAFLFLVGCGADGIPADRVLPEGVLSEDAEAVTDTPTDATQSPANADAVVGTQTDATQAPANAEAASDTSQPAQPLPDSSSGGEPYKIFITSDIHCFYDVMHDDSDAYNQFISGGDGKMLSLTDPIMNAFINDALIERPDAVIITGDLTVNGEKTGHEINAALFKRLTDAGITVCVVPGNHDINNPSARLILDGEFRYEKYVSPDEFAEIYADCGYGSPLYRDIYSLSYITRLDGGLYAVMLDTAMYAANIENKRSNASGTVYEPTLNWLDASVTEIKTADPEARFITSMHHNMFVHHSNFDFGYVLYSAAKTKELFQKHGLNAVFSGHIHLQHILTQDGITEFVDSSLIVYPVAYGVIEADETGLRYKTQAVNMSRYAEQNNLTDAYLFDFENYTREAFSERAASRMTGRLRELNYSEEDVEEAVKTVQMLQAYYFAGRIDEMKDEIMARRGWQLLQETGMADGYIESVFVEGAGEHNRMEIGW
jgi:3',5'-cyclic AMP phosphodiesterase CpdA